MGTPAPTIHASTFLDHKPTYSVTQHINKAILTRSAVANINKTQVIIIIIIIILESAVQGRERVRTLSVQRPQPHTTNPWKQEKDKTVRDKQERADHANRKALALLLKPASPTPSNTGSLRSFQRDTERGTKLLRY